MTSVEFSNEFDILYNNIMSNSAPGLNEYEKSFFLTKAQEELIKNYFEPLGNKYKKGLDDSPKRQIDFSKLIKISTGILVNNPVLTLDSRSKVYQLPNDLLIISNEVVETNKGTLQVIPLSYDDYTRLMSKPYKEPLRYQAWRLITNSSSSINSEIIVHTGDLITEYKIKYIKKPTPIITSDLEDYSVTINGISTVSECELDSIIHPEILQRAVELAKSTYQGDLKTSIELGNRSE